MQQSLSIEPVTYQGGSPSEAKYFRENFRIIWQTLTEIGRNFDLSAIKTGKLLVEMGLRDTDGSPSDFAIANGFSWTVEESRYNGEPYYLWNAELTIKAITEYLDEDEDIFS